MKPFPLSWIGAVLTLRSVSSAAAQLTFTELPNEMQHAILILENVDFCDYVYSVAAGLITSANQKVENIMLTKVAEEERHLNLDNDPQRVRKQQIIKSICTFVGIRSKLPVIFKQVDADSEELGLWAEVLESNFETCSSFSESPTWKKACMAGLFGRNTLIKLLPHLSKDFCSNNKALLLQTAFFIGDINALEAIVTYFGMSSDEVLECVPESDIVFSGSMPFLTELFDFLPTLMEKRLGLIREASSLNRLDIILRILEVAKPVEPHELAHILDSFRQLKHFKIKRARSHFIVCKVSTTLEKAAQHGHLLIIRFLWPAVKLMWGSAECAVRDMMIGAGSNNHRSIIEFLLWQSGEDSIKVAQHYVNDAFKAAIGGGHVELLKFLMGDDNAGNPVAPGLSLSTLSRNTLSKAIRINRNWDGIKHLVDLKEKGDGRFADLELVDHDNTALCMACGEGDYGLVNYLFCRTDDGEFVFPLTNPAAQDNTPLANACLSGNLQIINKLLERDVSGKHYIYKGIDPSAQNYLGIINACTAGRLDVVELLLKMKDGDYVLPKLGYVDLGYALSAAIEWNQMAIVIFFLKHANGQYLLPGMECVDLTLNLSDASGWGRMEVVRYLLQMEDGKYVLPGMESVKFTRALILASKCNEIEMLRFFLRMEDGKYVLSRMDGADLAMALSTAIKWNQVEIVKFLLSRTLDGSYLHPGVGVTSDMLTIPDIGPEMREFLEGHIEQQRINA